MNDTRKTDEVVSRRRAEAELRLTEAIETRTATCVVVGLGYVGTIAMQALIRAGFEVHGYDRSLEAVARFRTQSADLPHRSWSVDTEDTVLASADIVLVTVRVLVQPDGSIDLEPLKAAARSLVAYARPQRLILIGSTLPPGMTRKFANDWLGTASDSEVFVAHCPERLQAGNTIWTFKNIPHLAGGLDAAATRLAKCFLSKICDSVVTVSLPEISELSKLLENAFLAVGIGLVGEMTRLAHTLGVSASEVTAAAATKPFGYYAFHPGPGIGGHCIPNDLRILLQASRDLGLEALILHGAFQTATGLPRIVVDYLEHLMALEGISLAGTQVLLVGMGFKTGSDDTTETPARDVIRYLRSRGAIPVFMDSRVQSFKVDGRLIERIDHPLLATRVFPAGIVLAGDPAVEGEKLKQSVHILLDAGGGQILMGGLSGVYRL